MDRFLLPTAGWLLKLYQKQLKSSLMSQLKLHSANFDGLIFAFLLYMVLTVVDGGNLVSLSVKAKVLLR